MDTEQSGPLTVRIVAPSGASVNGLVEVLVEVEGGKGGVMVNLALNEDAPFPRILAPAIFELDTCGLADGAHALLATAFDQEGTEAQAKLSVTVANADVGPTLIGKISDGRARLEWQQCGAFGSYRVFWSDQEGVEIGASSVTTDARYLVTEVDNPGSTYFYRVAPIGSNGLGSLSNEVELIPRTLDWRVCSEDGWCWDHGPPQGGDLVSVWSSDDDNVVASAQGATIHYDGLEWFRKEAPVSNWTGALWGTSHDNLWRASFRIEHFDGVKWKRVGDLDARAIWGTDASHIWAYGYDGVFQYDGKEWALLPEGDLSQFHPADIWVSAANDVWIAGNGIYGARGSLVHFDGTEWGLSSTNWENRSAVWGTASDDVWSVGEHGQILHFDGSGWEVIPSGTVEDLADIHGCAADNVWAVGDFGKVLHWNGHVWQDRSPNTRLNWAGVWCNDVGTTWIVGERGETLRFDGGWSQLSAQRMGPLRAVAASGDGPLVSGEYETLLLREASEWHRLQGTNASEYPNVSWWDMHGTGPTDVWVVGDAGAIAHRGSGGWDVLDPVASHRLTALWALSEIDVWAGGDSGVLLRFDGNSWTPQSTLPTSRVHDLWGASSDDVWMCGWEGMWHWDGISWEQVLLTGLPAGQLLDSIWGSASDDVWATSSHGTIMHFDGSAWKRFDPGVYVNGFLNRVNGSAADDVWISQTGGYLRWDGAEWTSFESQEIKRAIWAASENDAWSGGSAPYHWDGVTWTQGPAIPSVHGRFLLWGADTDNVFAHGDSGTVFRFNGAEWQRELPAVSEPRHLGDMWVESPKSAWIVGDYGTIRHFDGEHWETHESGTLAQLFAIAAVSSDDIWVAGQGGTMLHYDGASWAPVDSGTEHSIRGLWASGSDSVFAAAGTFPGTGVAYNGTVLRWDGSTWKEEDIPHIPTLTDVWGAAPDDVWAVGESSSILHFDGHAWTDVSLPGTTITSVWGRSASDVWAVGASGLIWHFDGQAWSYQEAPGRELLLAVGGDDEMVWAVGDRGTIWRQAQN